jgi:hypothetical protein
MRAELAGELRATLVVRQSQEHSEGGTLSLSSSFHPEERQFSGVDLSSEYKKDGSIVNIELLQAV